MFTRCYCVYFHQSNMKISKLSNENGICWRIFKIWGNSRPLCLYSVCKVTIALVHIHSRYIYLSHYSKVQLFHILMQRIGHSQGPFFKFVRNLSCSCFSTIRICWLLLCSMPSYVFCFSLSKLKNKLAAKIADKVTTIMIIHQVWVHSGHTNLNSVFKIIYF